jgi:hypothetical protein
LEKTFPEIPPGLPFSKGGEPFRMPSKKDSAFSPFEKGEEGGFDSSSKD